MKRLGPEFPPAETTKLLVMLNQIGKTLFDEGQKDRTRAGLEKKWIGKDVRGPGIGCSLELVEPAWGFRYGAILI